MSQLPIPDTSINTQDVSTNFSTTHPFTNHVIVRKIFNTMGNSMDLMVLSQINRVARNEILHLLRKLHEVQFFGEKQRDRHKQKLQFATFTAYGLGHVRASLMMLVNYGTNLRSLEFINDVSSYVNFYPLKELKNLQRFVVNKKVHQWIGALNSYSFLDMLINNVATLKEIVHPPIYFLSIFNESDERFFNLDFLEMNLYMLKPTCQVHCTFVYEADDLFLSKCKKNIKVKKLVLNGHNKAIFMDAHARFIQLTMVSDLVLKASQASISDDYQYIQNWRAQNETFPKVERFEFFLSDPVLTNLSLQELTSFITKLNFIFPNLKVFELQFVNSVPRDMVSHFHSRFRNYWYLQVAVFNHHVFITYPKSKIPNDETLDKYTGTFTIEQRCASKFTVSLTCTCK